MVGPFHQVSVIAIGIQVMDLTQVNTDFLYAPKWMPWAIAGLFLLLFILVMDARRQIKELKTKLKAPSGK